MIVKKKIKLINYLAEYNSSDYMFNFNSETAKLNKIWNTLYYTIVLNTLIRKKYSLIDSVAAYYNFKHIFLWDLSKKQFWITVTNLTLTCFDTYSGGSAAKALGLKKKTTKKKKTFWSSFLRYFLVKHKNITSNILLLRGQKKWTIKLLRTLDEQKILIKFGLLVFRPKISKNVQNIKKIKAIKRKTVKKNIIREKQIDVEFKKSFKYN